MNSVENCPLGDLRWAMKFILLNNKRIYGYDKVIDKKYYVVQSKVDKT